MKKEYMEISGIPTIIWGEPSEKAYIFVHGKMSDKEIASHFAETASQKGYQTISFDLAEHGERAGQHPRCDIWNGITDLNIIGEFVFEKWHFVSLFACSLGAFFSLHAFNRKEFQKCLFQSPILDMEYLIYQMFLWFDVSENRLEEQQEISTPIDILSWKYYRYVKEHPTQYWNCPTQILYGAKDDLQSFGVIKAFCDKFQCGITVSDNSGHAFAEEGSIEIINNWFEKFI